MLGFVTTFPIVYIPVINDKVFLHAPISWEVSLLDPTAFTYISLTVLICDPPQWGIVFVGALIFLVLVEIWKFAKRMYFRHEKRAHAAAIAGIPDLEV